MKLTEQQLEAAAEAARNAYFGGSQPHRPFNRLHPGSQATWKAVALAVLKSATEQENQSNG